MIFSFIFFFIVLILSVVLHEVSHGMMALHLGDTTAKDAGRLTLNPLKHLDLVGSVFLPLILIIFALITGEGIIFGWAKPVPINPRNFRDKKYGEAKVALAGPLSNIGLALAFGLPLRFIPFLHNSYQIYTLFSIIVYVNLLLALFNLLPIPPLDGAHILFTFLPRRFLRFKVFLLQFGFFILLFFIFFCFKWFLPIIGWFYKLIVGYSFVI